MPITKRPKAVTRPTAPDGEKLRRLRYEAGLTQLMLAERSGSSFQHISDMETGRRGARPPVIARLAKALGCKVADLMPDPRKAIEP